MNSCPTCKTPIPADAPSGFCPTCLLRKAETTEPNTPLGINAPSCDEVSAAFPKLEITKLIGQGGMGYVYQAQQPELSREVALKILSPELGKDPAFTERFAREARVLGQLSHPNIVTIYEHGESNGYYYLLMEYVDGVNLREAMSAGRFTPEQALAIVPTVCDALQAAHSQGIWHRDIKPENILLNQAGDVKIADFGIARLVGDTTKNFTLTNTGNALGSAPYMSPEQHENPHDVDHRADIYSLGVVIYEMLTGELPLGRFPAPSEKSAVSARIDDIVFQTLEKDRELRQQSATEVKTDVTRAGHNHSQKAPPTKQSSIAPITAKSIALLLTGPALALAAGVFTYGSFQGFLICLAILLFIVGNIFGIQALSQMKNHDISQGWRAGLRTLVWATPILILLSIVSLFLYYSAKTNTQKEALAAEETAKKDIKQEAAKITPPQQTPQNAPLRVRHVPGPPPYITQLYTGPFPETPANQILKEMNRAANESDGTTFKKHLDSSGTGNTVASKMLPFRGELLSSRRITPLASFQSYNQIHRGYHSLIFATFANQVADAPTTHRVFVFRIHNFRNAPHYRFQELGSIPYEVYSILKFTPPKGDPKTILQTHLNSHQAITPVPDQENHFKISLQFTSDPNENTDHQQLHDILESLDSFDLKKHCQIIQETTLDQEPWHLKNGAFVPETPPEEKE